MDNSGKSLDQVHSVFNSKSLRKLWMKIRYIVAVAVLFLVAPIINPDWFWIGFAVSLFGEISQLWCWSCLRTSKVLAYRGPYTMVRNPMYLSRYFIVLGIFLLVGIPGLVAAIPATIFYGFYMVNRVEREEKKLLELFGQDYEDYYNTVPRFIPTFRNFDLKAVMFWNWETFHENHGTMNLLGVLAVYTLFYLYVFVI